MSGRGQGPYDSIARRWLALIERRQENFIDLCNTGRWRHYYTKTEFLEEMRKVLRLRDHWADLAGEPLQGDDAPFLQNIQTPHRVLPERLVSLAQLPDEPEGEAALPQQRRRVSGLPAAHWPE